VSQLEVEREREREREERVEVNAYLDEISEEAFSAASIH
jgi:hypothetical protein